MSFGGRTKVQHDGEKDVSSYFVVCLIVEDLESNIQGDILA